MLWAVTSIPDSLFGRDNADLHMLTPIPACWNCVKWKRYMQCVAMRLCSVSSATGREPVPAGDLPLDAFDLSARLNEPVAQFW